MYHIERNSSSVLIDISDRSGGCTSPKEAAIAALDNWNNGVRLIVSKGSDTILNTKLKSKLLKWAESEYRRLPKCLMCSMIVESLGSLCSEVCKEKRMKTQILDDNEESEFFL
jgi:hypothetical protein